MRIEIQDVTTGQSIYSEVVDQSGRPSHQVVRWLLSNQTINTEKPETIQVVVWMSNDLGDAPPDVVLTGERLLRWASDDQ